MAGKRCRILLSLAGRLCLWVAIASALVGLSRPVRAAAAAVSGVRSTSFAIRELIDDAMWESPTFRGLVRRIVESDGIVYVEDGVCHHSVHACLLLDVTPAGGYRILRILVDRQGVLAQRGRLDVMATIGHELSHALEVLGDRNNRSGAAMYLFYMSLSPTSHHTFETRAAIAAGSKIRSELSNHVVFVFQQVAQDFR